MFQLKANQTTSQKYYQELYLKHYFYKHKQLANFDSRIVFFFFNSHVTSNLVRILLRFFVELGFIDCI